MISAQLYKLFRTSFGKCLVDEQCTEKAIKAHSMSRALLLTIADEGEVIIPEHELKYPGDLEVIPPFRPEVISKASTGRFACDKHDKVFNPIDTLPMDFKDPTILNLLFYRAVLKEPLGAVR